MPDNLPNIPIPKGIPVDLYDATGITVGVQIEAQNVGCSDVNLYSQAASPLINDDGNQVIERNEYLENDEGDSGAWAISQHQNGLLNVKVAT